MSQGKPKGDRRWLTRDSIALCVHLQFYLMLSILILNETIRVDLIV